ncbi:DUF262 domain-containing protein [Paenactinomyces guangxiensis]|uniref:DUF262 domain-containing protein n=1 Tax=Paenactinomyces guangxiensis TaxID=1490290 RepID=A0A7W2A974_9BACL|nr:DUF262 domain-containing protein [Paenactinomyces guangxiensis]MBH8590850.1 DUF262 domain-containing protein [Paenactinomyces guangxiensis]
MLEREIEAKKKKLNDIFSDFWFLVPEYQRSYVWGNDQVKDLLDDLWFASENNPTKEYFLGSLVLRNMHNDYYKEYEILDGQQRLTTLLLLMAVLRDTATNHLLKDSCKKCIYQDANPYSGIPSRVRIIYKIRDQVEDFIQKYIQEEKGLDNKTGLQEEARIGSVSTQNMVSAIFAIKDFFSDKTQQQISQFAQFLFQKVVLIYVSTDNREDAFRLFTILNNRGVPLSSADILKSMNIGEIDEKENEKYARVWEEIESDLGEDFDRFLSFVRTVLVKEKQRVNLLEEYEENIYKKKLLEVGKPTIDLIKKYKSHYDDLIKLERNDLTNDYRNLVTIMQIGLPSEDWIPPLLLFYEKFGIGTLDEFVKKLEYKFTSDWLLQYSPTQRIENMNRILKAIEKASYELEILNQGILFQVDQASLRNVLNGDIYGRKFARYILLKYEYLKSLQTVHLSNYKHISVEHVLPQNPKVDSKWVETFPEKERKFWVHKLANLVLINKIKNSSLSNLDFSEKKERYLKKRIDVFVGCKVFIYQANNWTPGVLKERQIEMVDTLVNNLC